MMIKRWELVQSSERLFNHPATSKYYDLSHSVCVCVCMREWERQRERVRRRERERELLISRACPLGVIRSHNVRHLFVLSALIHFFHAMPPAKKRAHAVAPVLDDMLLFLPWRATDSGKLNKKKKQKRKSSFANNYLLSGGDLSASACWRSTQVINALQTRPLSPPHARPPSGVPGVTRANGSENDTLSWAPLKVVPAGWERLWAGGRENSSAVVSVWSSKGSETGATSRLLQILQRL